MKMDKEQAQRLNDYIDSPDHDANQLYGHPSWVPPSSVPPSDRRVVDALRQSVERIQPASEFVHALSGRLQAESTARPAGRGRLWLGRALRFAVALGAIALLALWLPWLWRGEFEPAVSPTLIVAEATVGAPTRGAPFTFPDAPAELPLYSAELATAPTTPQAALAWAEAFGMPDPQLYYNQSQPGAIILIGDDNSQLTFGGGPQPHTIHYSPAQPATPPDPDAAPLSFEAAAEVAVTFLSARKLLPDPYHVAERQPFDSNNPVREVVVSPDLSGLRVESDLQPVAALRIGPDGVVIGASFTPLPALTPGQTVAIRSAEETFNALAEGRLTPMRTATQAMPANPIRHYSPPPPQYEIGQQITVAGWPSLLVSADGGDVRATLSAQRAFYELTGSIVAELLNARDLTEPNEALSHIEVEGRITGQDDAGIWTLEMTAWQPIERLASTPPTCLVGALQRQGEESWLAVESGAVTGRYTLQKAPEGLQDGERIEVCLLEPPAPGDEALNWIHISAPPASEAASAPGAVVEEMVAREVVEVEVTRVVTHVLTGVGPTPALSTENTEAEALEATSDTAPEAPSSPPGTTGGSSSVTVVEETVSTSEEPPESPYEMGQRVTISGTIVGAIYQTPEGEAPELHLEVQTEDGLWFSFPLLADEATLIQLADERYRLTTFIEGTIVPAPEQMPGAGHGQAIEVAAFRAVWSDEKIEGFLGYIAVETIEGAERVVLTTVEEERYVVDWPPQAASYFEEEQRVFLQATAKRGATIGGLPILQAFNTSTGSNVDDAASAAELPLQTSAPRINRPDTPGSPGFDTDDMVLERMELVYYLNLRYEGGGPGSTDPPRPTADQHLEPVWLLYAHDPSGLTQYEIILPAAIRE